MVSSNTTFKPGGAIMPSASRRGSALVDIVVGTVLLGIALSAMISLIGKAAATQSEGEHVQTAAALLDEQLNLVLMRGPDNYAARFPTVGNCDPPFESYRFRLDFSGGTGGDPYRVTAAVLWDSPMGERSARVETLVAPRLGENTDADRQPTATVERPVQ